VFNFIGITRYPTDETCKNTYYPTQLLAGFRNCIPIKGLTLSGSWLKFSSLMRYHRRQVLSAEHVHFCPQNLTLGGNAPEMLKVLVRLLFDFPQTVILSTVGEQTYHETCCFQLCRPWCFGTRQEHFSDQKRAVCFGIVFHWLQKLWTAMLYRNFNLMISLCKVRSFKMSMLSNFIHQLLQVESG